MMENRKSKSVFQNTNYVLLFLGVLISHLGASFYNFAVGFYILKITSNNAFIQGVYLAVAGLVVVITSPLGGVLADRWNKVKIIYGTDLIKGFVVILAALLIYFAINNNDENLQLIILFGVAIIFNFVGAIFSPASSSIIKFIVDEDQYQQASSYLSSIDSLLGIIGVILAGIFYTIMPIYYLFILIGILYILSGISEMFIKYHYEKTKQPLTLKYIINDFKDGFNYILTKKALLYLSFGALFANFFVTPIFNNLNYFISVYVKGQKYIFDHLFEPEFWSSIISVAISLGTISTSLVYGLKKQKERFAPSILKGFFLIAFVFIAASISFIFSVLIWDNINIYLISLFILMILCGVALIMVNIPISTYRYKIVESDKLAKVNSLMVIGTQGLMPIASFVGGIIIQALGIGYLLSFCALGLLITSIMLASSKTVRAI